MNRTARSAISIGLGLFGGFGVMWLVITMNRMDRTPKKPPEQKEIAFDVPEKRKAPPTRKPRPKPRPKPTPKTPPPPIPQLAQAVGGVDVGLWAGSVIDLSDGANSLLGDGSNVVMTAETVDSLPSPQGDPKIVYPPSAQRSGVTGFVLLALNFDARGNITSMQVVESVPPGTFEEAAKAAAKSVRWRPATFQGQAVPVNGVELPLNFDLTR